MTLNEYKKLSKAESYPLIRNEAILLSTIFEEHLVYNLFYLDSFYIEVRYSELSHKVESIKAFEDDASMQRYINAVDIVPLISSVGGVSMP